jgi:hypothetical protein
VGLGSALFGAIDAGRFGAFDATALGVTPGNARARRLYERLAGLSHFPSSFLHKSRSHVVNQLKQSIDERKHKQ